MENPKALNVLYVTLLLVAVGVSIVLSIRLDDFSIFLYTLGVLGLMVIGGAVIALVFAVEIGPLLWLVSWLSGKKRKRNR
jgi:uncharacterized membrane protein